MTLNHKPYDRRLERIRHKAINLITYIPSQQSIINVAQILKLS